MKIVDDNLFANPLVQDDFFEDFNELDVVGKWADTSGDTGAAPTLATDGESAVILTTGATDNNEAYLDTNRVWDVVADKPITIDMKMKYTEANTDDANILMGLMSAAGANALLDNGGGPAASYSGAVFFKADGDTVWSVETSVGGTQTTTVTDEAAGSSTYSIFRIEIRPIDSTRAEVVFSIGQSGGSYFKQCRDANGDLIRHEITYTSFAAAPLCLGVKAGDTNSETPRWDYVRVSQRK